MHENILKYDNRVIKYSFLYSTIKREYLELYFKFKNKHDFSLSDNEYNNIKQKISIEFGTYDLVIYPETSSILLADIASLLGENTLCIKKNSKDIITSSLLKQQLMKAEKVSLLNAINDMGNDFKIHLIKGNQRKRFYDILFKKYTLPDTNKKVLILDDAVFSGGTLIALAKALNIDCDYKVIFSK